MHAAAFSRGAQVVRDVLDGHRPQVWTSDRYSAQQSHADRQQTCLAHYADLQIMPTTAGNLASAAVIVAMESA